MKFISTPVKAIRKKCLDCCNGSRTEVRYCTIIQCDLFPYRLGHRPNQVTLDTIKQYYEEKPPAS